MPSISNQSKNILNDFLVLKVQKNVLNPAK